MAFPLLRTTTLQEELQKKAAALSDIQQQLEQSEQDKAALKVTLDTVTEEGKTKHAELDRKAQSLAGDLQKAQQEKEAQRKELASVQESLGKAKKALKESQSQLDTERKNHKSAVGEKVGSVSCSQKLNDFSIFQFWEICLTTKRNTKPPNFNTRALTTLICVNPQEKANEKARQELLKNNEAITKAMNESKEQLEQMREVSFWGVKKKEKKRGRSRIIVFECNT